MGDMVNRFQHGSLVMQLADSETARIPTVLFGTLTGAIGVVASLPPDTFALLEKLQVRCVAVCSADCIVVGIFWPSGCGV